MQATGTVSRGIRQGKARGRNDLPVMAPCDPDGRPLAGKRRKPCDVSPVGTVVRYDGRFPDDGHRLPVPEPVADDGRDGANPSPSWKRSEALSRNALNRRENQARVLWYCLCIG
jgi:hypothetical protein